MTHASWDIVISKTEIEGSDPDRFNAYLDLWRVADALRSMERLRLLDEINALRSGDPRTMPMKPGDREGRIRLSIDKSAGNVFVYLASLETEPLVSPPVTFVVLLEKARGALQVADQRVHQLDCGRAWCIATHSR